MSNPRISDCPPSIAWHQSRVIVGALVALVFLVLDRFDVATAFLPGDQAMIVDLILLLTGSAGAGVAVHARVTQRHVPPITVGGGGGAAPLMVAVLLFVSALPLGGCMQALSRVPGSPSVVADETAGDEGAGIAIEALYTLGARTGALAFRLGLVPLPKQPETQRDDFCAVAGSGSFQPADRGAELMLLECRLRALRDAGRAAYDAGNAASYEGLLAKASAVADRIAAITK